MYIMGASLRQLTLLRNPDKSSLTDCPLASLFIKFAVLLSMSCSTGSTGKLIPPLNEVSSDVQG